MGISKELSPFFSNSLTNPHLKMGRINNQRQKMKRICLKTRLVIKHIMLFSPRCSHQMLIIFQVIVPNLRSQQEEKENYPQPFSSQEEAPSPGSSPNRFSPHRTLALQQLQTGSVISGSDLEVRKPSLPKPPLPELHLFCIKFISTVTKYKCGGKRLKYFSVNKAVYASYLNYSMLWQTYPKMTPRSHTPVQPLPLSAGRIYDLLQSAENGKGDGVPFS